MTIKKSKTGMTAFRRFCEIKHKQGYYLPRDFTKEILSQWSWFYAGWENKNIGNLITNDAPSISVEQIQAQIAAIIPKLMLYHDRGGYDRYFEVFEELKKLSGF